MYMNTCQIKILDKYGVDIKHRSMINTAFVMQTKK